MGPAAPTPPVDPAPGPEIPENTNRTSHLPGMVSGDDPKPGLDMRPSPAYSAETSPKASEKSSYDGAKADDKSVGQVNAPR